MRHAPILDRAPAGSTVSNSCEEKRHRKVLPATSPPANRGRLPTKTAAKHSSAHIPDTRAHPVWQAQNACTAGRLPSIHRRDAMRLMIWWQGSVRVPVENPEKALFRWNAIPREGPRSAAGRAGGHGERMRDRPGQLLVTAPRARDECEEVKRASKNCLSLSQKPKPKPKSTSAFGAGPLWVSIETDQVSIFCADSAAETSFRRPRRGTRLVAK